MSDHNNYSGKLKEKQEYIIRVFDQTKQFTEGLIKENDKLRATLSKLKKQVNEKVDLGGLKDKLSATEAENAALKQQLAQLKENLHEIEEENREFAENYVKIEQQSNSLASLYVASYRLHSTLIFSQVLDIVKEIVINLIGSECFGVYLADKENRLLLVAHEGLEDSEKHGVIQAGEGTVGNAFAKGEDYRLEDLSKKTDVENPITCVCLKIHDECIGVIAIYKLLGHKDKLEALDFELCELLASHAATAIYSSQLYSQVERKLDTFKGLLDLIKVDENGWQ